MKSDEEGNTDEIRMEITSSFVKAHKDLEKRHGETWIARITGVDQKYGYGRDFLGTTRMGRKKVFLLKDFYVDEVYEVSAIGWRDTFLCKEITDTHVVFELISNEEVLERCGCQKDVAVTLVQQLLKVTTKERAMMLIQKY